MFVVVGTDQTFRLLLVFVSGIAFLSSIILHFFVVSNFVALLDCANNHPLLLVLLAQVVPIEAQVTLFAVAEEELGAEAAGYYRGNGQDHYDVWSVLHPF